MQNKNLSLFAIGSILVLSVFLYLGYRAATNINSKKRTSINASNLDAKKDSLNTVFQGAVAQFDSTLITKNSEKPGLSYITDAEYAEYVRLKSEISGLLQPKQATTTDADLQRAMVKIKDLQSKLSELQARNTAVEANNKRLTAVIQKMMNEQKALARRAANNTSATDADVADAVDASTVVNSRTAPAVVKYAVIKTYNASGDVMTETNYVENANKLQGIIQLKNQSNGDMYVVVEDPHGNVLKYSDWDSGMFTTSDGKRRMYTMKIKNNVGEMNQTFQIDLPEDKPKGNYKMYVYSNGVKAFSASKLLN